VVITLTEARRRLGRLVTHARISGESIIITDRDEPVAMLVPVVPSQRVSETAGVPATASRAPLPASSATEG
jgi:prevent-host-death family protein